MIRHLTVAALLVATPASAFTVKSKHGATANVSASAGPKFQAFINDLEAAGATILFMGGTRRERCSPRHMHGCGLALDYCQLRRGVVDRRCRIPNRYVVARIAARHGLFEGGQWCNSDYGHVQLGLTAAACGTRYAEQR